MKKPPNNFLGYDDKVAIGKRLRLLSELTDGDVRRVYQTQKIDFQQRWFGLLNQLVLNGPMSVGEISIALSITHASVSETRKSLEAKGLIVAVVDKKDARTRHLSLSPTGHNFMNNMEPVFQAIEDTAAELNEEVGNLIAALDQLHEALKRKSFYDRASEKLEKIKRKDE